MPKRSPQAFVRLALQPEEWNYACLQPEFLARFEKLETFDEAEALLQYAMDIIYWAPVSLSKLRLMEP